MKNIKYKLKTIISVTVLAILGLSNSNAATLTDTTSSRITLEELEQGTCLQVMVSRRFPGFKGYGYINPQNSLAGRIEWRVKSPNGGRYQFTIRFANSSNEAMSGKLFINNNQENAKDIPMPPTGSLSDWKTATLEIDLTKGENLLVLRPIGEKGMPNIDSITLDGDKPSAGDCPVLKTVEPRETTDLSNDPIGWVTQGEGVSGGGKARPIIVHSTGALKVLASGDEPRVIHIDGKLNGTLHVGSNKTIIGLKGAQISSENGVLRLKASKNVIIRNLTLVGSPTRFVMNSDLRDSENIWLDHNSFIDGGPDLLNIAGTSDKITVSWNLFRHTRWAHEHFGVQIGALDSETQGIGKLRVTMHHNYFAELVNERMPRVRFGQVHLFNNFSDAGTEELTRSYYAIRAGVDANIRSENNLFLNFIGPSWWWTSEKLGNQDSTVFNYTRGNKNSILQSIGDVCQPECIVGPVDIKEHEGVTGKAGFYSVGTAFIPPYKYTALKANSVENVIRKGAGAR